MHFEENLKRVDVVYVLLTDSSSKKVLTVQNENGSWSLPGGKREPGETLEQASIREAKEETGLEVTVDGMIQIIEHFSSDHVLFFTFYGRIIGGTLSQGDGEEILQVRWMSINEALEKMPWLHKQVLLQPNIAHYKAENH